MAGECLAAIPIASRMTLLRSRGDADRGNLARNAGNEPTTHSIAKVSATIVRETRDATRGVFRSGQTGVESPGKSATMRKGRSLETPSKGGGAPNPLPNSINQVCTRERKETKDASRISALGHSKIAAELQEEESRFSRTFSRRTRERNSN